MNFAETTISAEESGYGARAFPPNAATSNGGKFSAIGLCVRETCNTVPTNRAESIVGWKWISLSKIPRLDVITYTYFQFYAPMVVQRAAMKDLHPG